MHHWCQSKMQITKIFGKRTGDRPSDEVFLDRTWYQSTIHSGNKNRYIRVGCQQHLNLEEWAEPGSSSRCCHAVGTDRGGSAIRREAWAAGQTNGPSGSASVCPWMDSLKLEDLGTAEMPPHTGWWEPWEDKGTWGMSQEPVNHEDWTASMAVLLSLYAVAFVLPRTFQSWWELMKIISSTLPSYRRPECFGKSVFSYSFLRRGGPCPTTDGPLCAAQDSILDGMFVGLPAPHASITVTRRSDAWSFLPTHVMHGVHAVQWGRHDRVC